MIELFAVINAGKIEAFTVHRTKLGSIAAWVGRSEPKYKINEFTEHEFEWRTAGTKILVEKIFAYTGAEDASRVKKEG